MTACNDARHTDMEIREILDDQFQVVLRQTMAVVQAGIKPGPPTRSQRPPGLIRTLAGTTALMLTADPILVGREGGRVRRVRVLEQLRLHAR